MILKENTYHSSIQKLNYLMISYDFLLGQIWHIRNIDSHIAISLLQRSAYLSNKFLHLNLSLIFLLNKRNINIFQLLFKILQLFLFLFKLCFLSKTHFKEEILFIKIRSEFKLELLMELTPLKTNLKNSLSQQILTPLISWDSRVKFFSLEKSTDSVMNIEK